MSPFDQDDDRVAEKEPGRQPPPTKRLLQRESVPESVRPEKAVLPEHREEREGRGH